MNRLEQKLKELKQRHKKALSVFLTAGYPTPDSTEKLVIELEKIGVDFFEIGFPFSDPIADGPVIQRSSEEARRKGMNWEKILGIARRVRKKSQAPLIFMSYANTLYCRGWKNSIAQLKAAGFDGAIIPDILPDEEENLRAEFEKAGLSLVYLCAPTSGPERLKRIGRDSSGFIYCVSITGVTGARRQLPVNDIQKFLSQIKSRSRLPALLGFGISSVEHVDLLKKHSDGFVIGSALVKAIEGSKTSSECVKKAVRFLRPFGERLKY